MNANIAPARPSETRAPARLDETRAPARLDETPAPGRLEGERLDPVLLDGERARSPLHAPAVNDPSLLEPQGESPCSQELSQINESWSVGKACSRRPRRRAACCWRRRMSAASFRTCSG